MLSIVSALAKRKVHILAGTRWNPGLITPATITGVITQRKPRKGPKATGEEDHLPSRESADRVAALADNLNHNHIKKEGVFATVAESLTWIHKNG